MSKPLDGNEFGVVLDALKHYKMHIENYSGYPSYEFKQQQLRRVESAISKIKGLQGETEIEPD